MKIKVLGSSAGGGFPQWKCNFPNCDGFRRGTIDARRRTQSSLAVTTNSADWLLVNASPDILAQIASNTELQPARAVRDSGIAAILAMDAQIDHVSGLLMLREHHGPLPLYATAPVWQDLRSGFPIGPILSSYCGIEHRQIPADGGDGATLEIPFLTGACDGRDVQRGPAAHRRHALD
ncbi:pyrroloquinoline quinone biosynthesis protein PqqB [Caballeronia catudaia]|uniref:Coenzyme PQQ synthesis protein B n=1 Tax=Caballeronia catudaia TaxID=1777136 RepID=A0A158DSC0_9BURK|nr:pyrroloquinoline quinone biosynthesis protein PqqB [Caballeronia catudaia]